MSASSRTAHYNIPLSPASSPRISYTERKRTHLSHEIEEITRIMVQDLELGTRTETPPPPYQLSKTPKPTRPTAPRTFSDIQCPPSRTFTDLVSHPDPAPFARLTRRQSTIRTSTPPPNYQPSASASTSQTTYTPLPTNDPPPENIFNTYAPLPRSNATPNDVFTKYAQPQPSSYYTDPTRLSDYDKEQKRNARKTIFWTVMVMVAVGAGLAVFLVLKNRDSGGSSSTGSTGSSKGGSGKGGKGG